MELRTCDMVVALPRRHHIITISNPAISLDIYLALIVDSRYILDTSRTAGIRSEAVGYWC